MGLGAPISHALVAERKMDLKWIGDRGREKYASVRPQVLEEQWETRGEKDAEMVFNLCFC